MPETPQSPEGQNFVAPDELERIENPEKAEMMARASDWSHSHATSARKAYKALKDLGMDSDASTSPWKLYSKASDLERDAEEYESEASLAHEEEQHIAKMPIEELRKHLEQLLQGQIEVEKHGSRSSIIHLRTRIKVNESRLHELQEKS